MATSEGKKIGGTLTLLLVFVIAVVVIVVIFAYFDGLFKIVSGGSAMMSVSGAFALSGNLGNSGSVVVVVRDTGQDSIVGVSLNCPSSEFVSADCATFMLQLNGIAVTAQHPLTNGQTGTDTIALQPAPGTSFTHGKIYTIMVIATFSDGSTVSDNLVLPA